MKKRSFLFIVLGLMFPVLTRAGEADLEVPDLSQVTFFNGAVTGWELLLYGLVIVFLGLLFGYWQFTRIKKMPAHSSMLEVSKIIYETCKTYLLQQGRFLIILFVIIGVAITYYFLALSGMKIPKVLLILFWSVLGILGSYGVAWFGIIPGLKLRCFPRKHKCPLSSVE